MNTPSTAPRVSERRSRRVMLALRPSELEAIKSVAVLGSRTVASAARDMVLAGLSIVRDSYVQERGRLDLPGGAS